MSILGWPKDGSVCLFIFVTSYNLSSLLGFFLVLSHYSKELLTGKRSATQVCQLRKKV